MKHSFNVTVALPGVALRVYEAKRITIPCVSGYMGVMANHQPFLSALDAGIVHITDIKDNDIWFALSGGFCEMYDNNATMLCNSLIFPEDIDLDEPTSESLPLKNFNNTATEKEKYNYAKAVFTRKLRSINNTAIDK